MRPSKIVKDVSFRKPATQGEKHSQNLFNRALPASRRTYNDVHVSRRKDAADLVKDRLRSPLRERAYRLFRPPQVEILQFDRDLLPGDGHAHGRIVCGWLLGLDCAGCPLSARMVKLEDDDGESELTAMAGDGAKSVQQ